MVSPDDFISLNSVPLSLEEVVWPNLNPAFHEKCLKGLNLLTELCRSPDLNKMSFFVGAGISVYPPSNLPVANDVLRMLFEYCREINPRLTDALPVIFDAIAQGRYVLMENTFQHLYEIIQPRPFYAGRVFEVPETPSSYNINHFFLAKWLQSGRGTVVTTNLDPLIEHAWNSDYLLGSNPLKVIQRPEAFKNWVENIKQPNVLWKLHGSANDPDSWAITLSTVGFRLKDSRAEFLEHFLSQHNVCFVGYRAADLDLFPHILKAHINRATGTSTKMFWVFYFRDGYKDLNEYLYKEKNIAKLFAQNTDSIYPIVTNAQRLSAWLQSQCFPGIGTFPLSVSRKANYKYEDWLKLDVYTVGEIAVNNLIGYVLRSIGKHKEAIEVLDHAAELVTIRAAQITQESALTSQLQGDVPTTRLRLCQAARLLRETDDSLSKAWCLYEQIKTALEAKKQVNLFEQIISVGYLIHLYRSFVDLSGQYPSSTSPKLGIGLCIFQSIRLYERILRKTRLIALKRIRKILIGQYQSIENRVRIGGYVPFQVDVKVAQAFLLLPDNPIMAVEIMTDAVSIAEGVGQAYYELTCKQALTFAQSIKDDGLKTELLQFIEE